MTTRCPYDQQHILPIDSLLNHLRKCKAKNKHLFSQCKYDPLHIIVKEELSQHYKICKAKKKHNDKKEDVEDWDQPKKETIFSNWDDEWDTENIKKVVQRGNRGNYEDGNAAPPVISKGQESDFGQVKKYKKNWMKDSEPKKNQEQIQEQKYGESFKLEKKKKKVIEKESEEECFKTHKKSSALADWD